MPTAVLDAPVFPLAANPALVNQLYRVDPHADEAYFALTEATVRLAQADATHRCSRSCKQPARCQQDRVSARRFLSELRTGASQPWAAWVAVAAERALLKSGVRYRKPHNLRHAFASILISRGANILEVQEAGGWSSAAVLLRVYAKWIRDTKRSGARMHAPNAARARNH